jgi:hypothetical protein
MALFIEVVEPLAHSKDDQPTTRAGQVSNEIDTLATVHRLVMFRSTNRRAVALVFPHKKDAGSVSISRD